MLERHDRAAVRPAAGVPKAKVPLLTQAAKGGKPPSDCRGTTGPMRSASWVVNSIREVINTCAGRASGFDDCLSHASRPGAAHRRRDRSCPNPAALALKKARVKSNRALKGSEGSADFIATILYIIHIAFRIPEPCERDGCVQDDPGSSHNSRPVADAVTGAARVAGRGQ